MCATSRTVLVCSVKNKMNIQILVQCEPQLIHVLKIGIVCNLIHIISQHFMAKYILVLLERMIHCDCILYRHVTVRGTGNFTLYDFSTL